MRKIFCIAAALCLLVGCGTRPKAQNDEPQYITGVWISFLELDRMLSGDFKQEFSNAVKNSKQRGIGDMFVCVRPYCDAYYPSSLFPKRESIKGIDYDVLAYMIDTCHKSNIKFHAWVNPYRVRTSDSDTAALPVDSPAKKWAEAQDNKNVLIADGIYLNPASSEVRQLTIKGVREIINGYAVDGIHFDDYFYPTTDQEFDRAAYDEYTKNTPSPLSLADWRRANVNALISGVYTAVKFKNKDIIFSVSPSASIEDNFNKQYADVAAWVKSGCVDYIVPQLYFGFDYPDDSFKFDKLLLDWQTLTANSDTRLLIGLAAYKTNTDSAPDKVEWANGAEVIAKQTELCKKSKGVSGHIFFSYSAMNAYIK